MKIGQRINFILIKKQASSLYSLIADGNGRTTSLGRDKWKKLIGSRASLQSYCDQEGFNVKCDEPGRPKARIGILGNNENDCNTCDSRIGFGTGGKHDNSNTCGNEAKYGKTHIKAMGYILVQWEKTKRWRYDSKVYCILPSFNLTYVTITMLFLKVFVPSANAWRTVPSAPHPFHWTGVKDRPENEIIVTELCSFSKWCLLLYCLSSPLNEANCRFF